jgi:hypothetical protein
VSLFPLPPFIHRTLVDIAEYNRFVILTELAALGMLRRGLLRREGDIFVLTPTADAYITMYRKQKLINSSKTYMKEGIEWETKSHSATR